MNKKLWILCSAALGLGASYTGALANDSSTEINRTETQTTYTEDTAPADRPTDHARHHERNARLRDNQRVTHTDRWSREDVYIEHQRPPLTRAELKDAKLKLLSSKLPENERNRLEMDVARSEWCYNHDVRFGPRQYTRLEEHSWIDQRGDRAD